MDNKYYISVVGKSNVGKSTLINHLCNNYVTSSSSKPQTTRINLYNDFKINNLDISIIDTPGISINQNNLLSTSMKNEYLKTLDNINLLILMTDTLKFSKFENQIINLSSINNKIIYVVNKIDKLTMDNDYSQSIETLKDLYNEKIYFISLTKKLGLKNLIDNGIVKNLLLLKNNSIDSHHHLSDDKLLIQELIRGVIVENTKYELPYDSAVKVISFNKEKKLKKVIANIYVDKNNQKKIIIGKNGEMLKLIGSQSRKILENNFKCKFFLNLEVLVEKNWKNNYVFLKDIGYIR
ncbi:MAG: GTPase Era [Gammaproteobacteria bacterium]|nr:GTPase Era [Gammaproteobacteria bacterium]